MRSCLGKLRGCAIVDVCSGDGDGGVDDEQPDEVDKVGERGGDSSVSELTSGNHAFGSSFQSDNEDGVDRCDEDGVEDVICNEGTRFGCATQLLAGSSHSSRRMQPG